MSLRYTTKENKNELKKKRKNKIILTILNPGKIYLNLLKEHLRGDCQILETLSCRQEKLYKKYTLLITKNPKFWEFD